ncbi:uncharacterized protein N7525_000734 [Penicillium rubens]|jgi:hypothetical protein|uniref:uncharacterized protein n=1 Tax=Penicillium rubens TaxID=1108849 RepID=UPI002387E691|nr:uncharacterized protein N7525_000734 [Penicillium rubens]KAJ5276460.1 hypothetical protein N7524_002613 [Penicillium chrysogenum]KAJ5842993.1 hypothetical protein N7525_000734 [Penicillium rubens]KAJ5846427.1 hypothetical protein N7534_010096 [Penicillium rubens]
MPKTNKEIEIQIEKAIDSLSDQSKPNISKTAREFAVPESRLRRRWKGGKSLFQRPPNGRKLTPAQEAALCEYIEHFNTVGASINRRQIAAAADSILQEGHHDSSEDPPKIGEHWLQRFLKRHPEYCTQRREAHDESVAQRWSNDYERVVHEHEICHQDISRISLELNQCGPTTQRLKEALEKLAKGAEAQAALAYQLQKEFDRTQAIQGAFRARYDTSRHADSTGIINSSRMKETERREHELSEKADQEKTRRKWKKVLIEIRKRGRAKKRSGK